MFVRLFVWLLFCLSPKCKKTRFSQKQRNLELRKSYLGFSKNPLLDPWNPRWLRSAILKIDMTSLSRVSILTRDIDRANLSVRLTVRLSVTFRYHYQMKTAWHTVTGFSLYGSPIILVLPASNIFTKFRRGHPIPAGRKIQVGYKNFAIFYQWVAVYRKRYNISP